MTDSSEEAPGITRMASVMAQLGETLPVRGVILLDDGEHSCAKPFGYPKTRDGEALFITDVATSLMAIARDAGLKVDIFINGNELPPMPEDIEVTRVDSGRDW